MTASQKNPARRPPPSWVASLVRVAAAGLVLVAAFAMLTAIISAIGHGVHVIERDADALTPRPGSVPGGWQTIYYAVFALVYGYLFMRREPGGNGFGMYSSASLSLAVPTICSARPRSMPATRTDRQWAVVGHGSVRALPPASGRRLLTAS
jgi:hypothetical protein